MFTMKKESSDWAKAKAEQLEGLESATERNEKEAEEESRLKNAGDDLVSAEGVKLWRQVTDILSKKTDEFNSEIGHQILTVGDLAVTEGLVNTLRVNLSVGSYEDRRDVRLVDAGIEINGHRYKFQADLQNGRVILADNAGHPVDPERLCKEVIDYLLSKLSEFVYPPSSDS